MPAEPRLIALSIDRDTRLAAGAGGVARYLADSAGLSGDAPMQLQAETVQACLKAFESAGPAYAVLRVRFVLYTDRIEIELARAGQAAPELIERLTRYFGQTTAST